MTLFEKITTTGSSLFISPNGQGWYQPCPFGLGLRKFALDPVVVIFFKKLQKNYKWWSDPVIVNIFGNELNPFIILFCKKCLCYENHKFRFSLPKYFFFQKKITMTGSSAFQKKLQRLDQTNTCNFFVTF